MAVAAVLADGNVNGRRTKNNSRQDWTIGGVGFSLWLFGGRLNGLDVVPTTSQ